jgi:carboxyl-terminal processing protease
VTVTVRGLERPTFSYAVQVVDVEHGNGDGRISRGERVHLFVTVTNQGPGRSFESQANIKNESGEGVLIHDGRFQIGQVAVGETRSHAFEIEVLPSFGESEVEIELAITDFELREEVTESLRFPLIDGARALAADASGMRFEERAEVFEWPADDGHQVGWLAAGAHVRVGARTAGWARVLVEGARWGWVRATAGDRTAPPAEGAAPPSFEVRMDNTPPEVAFASAPPLSVRTAELPLRGVVTDADRVLDMYVFVGRRKVFYLSNREGRDLRRLSFDARLPLEEGSNFVLVVARESGDVVARRIMVIRREAGAAQARGVP